MKKIIIVLPLLLMMGLAWSQTNNQQVANFLKQGDDDFKREAYIEAVRYYKIALEEDPNNLKAKYQLAECYRLTQQYDNAEYYYEAVGAQQDIRYPLAGFYYALMQKLKGRYDQAMKNFQRFRQFMVAYDLHEQPEYRYYYKQAKIEIDGCQLALNQITLVHPDHRFKALGQPVNSVYNDYAAFSIGTDSTLCITSARGNGKSSLVDYQFGESFADLFRFNKTNGGWDEYKAKDKFESVINTKYGDGSGTFNRNRTKFYYTNCEENDGEICHVYVSYLSGGKWSSPVPLNHNVNEFGVNSKHPSLTPGGDTLFFVSDREGGLGGYDVYMSINAGQDNWGTAENLGGQINTPFNEISPYYDAQERVLFFASDGHRGFGGYDIFVARGSKFEKAEIYNAGIPFNSYRDDIFFYLADKRGYLSSNREEGVGKFDIYGFTIRSRKNIISEVSTEETIAGRNSLFTDDYNFDSNETEIINQIISRMLSSSVSDVEALLTQRQLAVYNSLSKDDKDRITRIVNARLQKLTQNMIKSIRTEDDYYYQQLSTDKRRKVDDIVSTYLDQQGMGNSVSLNDEVFGFYSSVSSDEREKIDILVSDRLKNAQNFVAATPTYNTFEKEEQKSLDGIAIKYIKQKKNLDGIALDLKEKVLLRDNKENTDGINTAVRERLIGLSNEDKYRLVKEDRDFYETLSADEKEKIKSLANTFMVSDLDNFNQNIKTSDLDLFKNKNTSDKNKLDKLLLKQISNLANSSIYLTETSFSQTELQASIGDDSEETIRRLLQLRPELNDSQRGAVERFVKTAYDAYLTEASPVFLNEEASIVTTEGTLTPGSDPTARLTREDLSQYAALSPAKKRAIDNAIGLDYLTMKYSDRSVKLSDEFKLKQLTGQEKVHIAALSKKISGKPIREAEKFYVSDAFVYYDNLAQDRKGFITRVVLDKGLPQRNGKYVLPAEDARIKGQFTTRETQLLERIKKFRFNNQRILTENMEVDAKDIDEQPVDVIALAKAEDIEDSGAKKLLGTEDILASEEMDEIRINLPINRISGYDEIVIRGRLVESNSGNPLSSYALTLLEFDNLGTVIEGYTNKGGEFEFVVSPAKYDITFKKATNTGDVVLEEFSVEGRREKPTTLFTNATRAFFDLGSYELRPEVKELLDDVVAAFDNRAKIEIESHTDATGSAELNLRLSKNRGYEALEYLTAKGIDKSKISVIWHGADKPIADNDNPYGRQLNRRIDIRLISQQPENFGNFYLVRPGANTTRIADAMGIEKSELEQTNRLSSARLDPYQPLRITGNNRQEPDYSLLVPADIVSGSDFTYTVKAGDDLPAVSKKFNVPEELLMEQNNLSSIRLEPGTVLIIYPKK